MQKLILAAVIGVVTIASATAAPRHHRHHHSHHMMPSRGYVAVPGPTMHRHMRSDDLQRRGSGQSASFGRHSGGTRSPGVDGDLGNR